MLSRTQSAPTLFILARQTAQFELGNFRKPVARFLQPPVPVLPIAFQPICARSADRLPPIVDLPSMDTRKIGLRILEVGTSEFVDDAELYHACF